MIGLVGVTERTSDEMRVTFLSVGHGGCTVIETPDGRVLLYDAGTMAGPDAVKRVIAPYLWQRGVRRIDELFLSHADLDHYNGVAQLLRRFPVGQVTMTPSFATKPAPEVAEVLLILERHRVPRRIAVAGESFTAGDVTLDALHPPLDGPGASENERSLVLKVSHLGQTILLTGDLEKAGTTLLLAQPPQQVDVLMAPHHGSPAALPQALLKWSQPKLVVVSRGQRASPLTNAPDAWDTWTHGAITFHSHATGLSAETFRTKQRLVVKRAR
jgi:competence protein ComEC